jgi:hypothetical protein
MASKKRISSALKPLVSFDFKLIQKPLEGLIMNVDRSLRNLVRRVAQALPPFLSLTTMRGCPILSRKLAVGFSAFRERVGDKISSCLKV